MEKVIEMVKDYVLVTRTKKKPKLTKAKIKYFIKDEDHAVKEYTRLGLHKLAADEKKHKKFFERKLKDMEAKK